VPPSNWLPVNIPVRMRLSAGFQRWMSMLFAERARTSVFRAIRYAIARAADIEPTLAAHLRVSIRTGAMCVYQADPLAPVSWSF
jgi:hypothetical protein